MKFDIFGPGFKDIVIIHKENDLLNEEDYINYKIKFIILKYYLNFCGFVVAEHSENINTNNNRIINIYLDNKIESNINDLAHQMYLEFTNALKKYTTYLQNDREVLELLTQIYEKYELYKYVYNYKFLKNIDVKNEALKVLKKVRDELFKQNIQSPRLLYSEIFIDNFFINEKTLVNFSNRIILNLKHLSQYFLQAYIIMADIMNKMNKPKEVLKIYETYLKRTPKTLCDSNIYYLMAIAIKKDKTINDDEKKKKVLMYAQNGMMINPAGLFNGYFRIKNNDYFDSNYGEFGIEYHYKNISIFIYNYCHNMLDLEDFNLGSNYSCDFIRKVASSTTVKENKEYMTCLADGREFAKVLLNINNDHQVLKKFFNKFYGNNSNDYYNKYMDCFNEFYGRLKIFLEEIEYYYEYKNAKKLLMNKEK